MSAHHEIDFPDDIAAGAVEVSPGVWNVGHGIKRFEQLSEVVAFYEARRGRLHSFRFKGAEAAFDTDYLEVDLSAFAAGAIPGVLIRERR